MCGRYTLIAEDDALTDVFDLAQTIPTQPRYNIAPTQSAPVIRAAEGNRTASLLHWGLIPSWAKDPAIASRLINARAETLRDKPSFRSAYKTRRCLVPASGFYEWKKLDVSPGKRSRKQPYYIHAGDGRLIAFAGLWEHWRDAGGQPVETFTIITTAPNDLVRPLHNRMPAILNPDHYTDWLDPDLNDPDRLDRLLHPCPDDWLAAHAVTTRVNSPTNDDPACLAPAETS